MKIAYFINTFKSINWGGQATSNGIKYLLSKECLDAKFTHIYFNGERATHYTSECLIRFMGLLEVTKVDYMMKGD